MWRRGFLALIAMVATVAMTGCAGMTAAEKREWTRAWIKVGQATACASAQLACQRYGGDDCAAWTKLGCTVSGSVADMFAAKTTPPTEKAITTTVTRAYHGLPAAPKKRAPGFRTPTKDGTPLKIQ